MRSSFPSSSKRQSSIFSATSLKIAKLVPVPSYVAPRGWALPGHTWVILGLPPALVSPPRGTGVSLRRCSRRRPGGATVDRCPRGGARTPDFGVSPDAVPGGPVSLPHRAAADDDAPPAAPVRGGRPAQLRRAPASGAPAP